MYRSDDGGDSWQPDDAGLPDGPYYGAVLRDAMTADGGDPAGVYFGTRVGEVYAARDGEPWTLVGEHLPLSSDGDGCLPSQDRTEGAQP